MRQLPLAIAFTSLVGCAHHGGGGTDGNGTYSSISIAPAAVTLTVPLDGTTTQQYQVIGMSGGQSFDISDRASLSVDSAFGSFATATLNVVAHGGTTKVLAAYDGNTATSDLEVNLVGAITTPGTPGNAEQLFGAATLGSDATHSPAVEYPIDNAVAPLNIPPIEVQWTTALDDLYHVTLASSHATINVYTTTHESMLTTDQWAAIAGTAVGEPLAISVEGLVQAAPATKYASPAVTLKLSHDTIDTSAIYWWASSQGSIISQTFGNTGAPTVVQGNCTACHSLSRAGSRIGYSRCSSGCASEYVGFLRYNAMTASWSEIVNADNHAINGTYTTFAPVGNPFPDDSQSVALVTKINGTFGLYDPDTGAAIASNLASVQQGGRSSLMADWSADGTSVVFASSAAAGQSIDPSGASIETMSYSYAGGNHTFGTPQMLVQQPMTINSTAYNNLFFPSYSPDAALVVFNAARTQWRNLSDEYATGVRLAMISTAPGATPIDLTAFNVDFGDHDATWPHWAPGNTNDYYWIVFSTERNYGHEITPTHTSPGCVSNGVRQCKQIWIGAISRAALATGAIDPSAPPMWLPGQDPAADNISPYWTVPAPLQ